MLLNWAVLGPFSDSVGAPVALLGKLGVMALAPMALLEKERREARAKQTAALHERL